MASTNDITGDAIQTRGVLSPEGEAAFDRIFGVKKKEKYIPPPLPDFDEDRIDTIGQNGNDGLHYNEI